LKLSANSSVFNMGDTSFRRKTLLDDYKEILVFLKKHLELYPEWKSNNEAQGIFYTTVMESSELFDRTKKTDPAKRGRTLTNALIKPGLINSKRQLGEAALNWIENNSKEADNLEKLMSLSIDNLVFLRQWFKLRVYSNNGEDYFYPFRVALELLSRYKDIPEKDFLYLLHTIEPSQVNNVTIKNIIEKYKLVDEKELSFEEYLDEYLPVFETTKEIEYARKVLSSESVNQDEFYKLFPNRKSSTSQEDYYYFYRYLLDFKRDKSVESLEKLLEMTKHSSIKKAFGFNKNPFNVSRRNKLNVEEFLSENKGNLLLAKDNTKLYTQFILSKKEDLIREYSDMTKRSFNLSGIISFDQGLVNLTQPWLFKKIIHVVEDEMALAGRASHSEYENQIDSPFYRELSLLEVIKLSDVKLGQVISELQEEFNIVNVTSLIQIVEQEKEERFRKVIEKEFNREKIIELLPLFSSRDDKEIRDKVTDAATVPTIFEYVMAIAWYHISDEVYPLLKSINLTLDGDFKPLTHAVGGEGDIIVEYPETTMMLEATLMNKNSQKRGELEPVIRHATNLTARKPNEVFSIFVADELDNNVVNIFRAVSQVELESTQSNMVAKSVNIFSLSLPEIRAILLKRIDSNRIFDVLREEYSNQYEEIKIGWREQVTQQIFS